MNNSKTLPQIKEIDWLIKLGLVLLALFLYFANYTNLDLALQNFFFDDSSKTWLINYQEPIKKFFFYILPKYVFGAGIIALIITYLRSKKPHHLLILIGLIIIPLTVGNIKKFTNIYCPNQLKIYDGKNPYVRIFEHYPSGFLQSEKGQCFPAGHCVTGFALMILFFAFQNKKQRILGLLASLICGWILGFYQMAKGAHFLSDTLVSMMLSFLFAALIYRFYYRFFDSKK